MRVTFLLPFVAESGGVRVVLEHARQLRLRGHEVWVLFPVLPPRMGREPWSTAGWRWWMGTLKLNLGGGWRRLLREVEGSGATPVPWISGARVPDADVVVATAWPCAEWVAKLAPRKGRKVYLVQHREVDAGPEARVDATYRLPLARLAGSEFTARTLERECGVGVEAVVPNGLDTSFWGAGAARERREVLIMASPGPRKGLADALEALRKIRAQRPDVPIAAFGPRRPAGFPDDARFVARPTDAELRDLYSGAAVFLYTSHYEGYGLPPLEAMAAGCAVVTTRVGAIPEFSADGESALWVEAGDVEGAASAVLSLLADEPRRARIAAGGVTAARRLDWSAISGSLERELLRLVAT